MEGAKGGNPPQIDPKAASQPWQEGSVRRSWERIDPNPPGKGHTIPRHTTQEQSSVPAGSLQGHSQNGLDSSNQSGTLKFAPINSTRCRDTQICWSSSTNLLEVVKCRQDDLVASSDKANCCQQFQDQGFCPVEKAEGTLRASTDPGAPCLEKSWELELVWSPWSEGPARCTALIWDFTSPGIMHFPPL